LAARGETRLRILLVGEGAEKTALIQQAAGLPNLTFLPPMPKRDVARLFAGSQIALHILADCPAFAEWTAPNKLKDGLAAGHPVISTAPGQAARLLADGGCGIAVPPGDAAGLAAALMNLVENPARRAAMGAAARSLAMRQHDRRLLAAVAASIGVAVLSLVLVFAIIASPGSFGLASTSQVNDRVSVIEAGVGQLRNDVGTLARELQSGGGTPAQAVEQLAQQLDDLRRQVEDLCSVLPVVC
jgi:hypothetical protein